jgi:hypothetical protein
MAYTVNVIYICYSSLSKSYLPNIKIVFQEELEFIYNAVWSGLC